MAETIERAKADDPKELRHRIAVLDKELKAVRVALAHREVVVERVEVPVLDEALLMRLEEALRPVAGVLGEVQDRVRWETTRGLDAVTMERKLAEEGVRLLQPHARLRHGGAETGEVNAIFEFSSFTGHCDRSISIANLPPHRWKCNGDCCLGYITTAAAGKRH